MISKSLIIFKYNKMVYTDEDRKWWDKITDEGNKNRSYDWMYDRTIINNCDGCNCLCYPKEEYICRCGTKCNGFKKKPQASPTTTPKGVITIFLR